MQGASSVTTLSEHACFGGVQGFYQHASEETGTPMRFGVFVPPQAKAGPVPVLFYLAGLTCTEETFAIKAGAQRHAAEHGLMLVSPDTSPRHTGVEGADAAWDFGTAAGFYLDATEGPWRRHWRMGSYVTRELRELVLQHFAARADRVGIFGHSMGGHGALVTALREPSRWHSVSAFAPIANPVAVPWGEKAFTGYLGPDRTAWAAWDASLLMRKRPYPGPILVDQGQEDQFLASQLHPEALEQAAAASGQELTLRRQPGDHSYWFIQSFIPDHIAHHARQLLAD